jgi:hypothetical protein
LARVSAQQAIADAATWLFTNAPAGSVQEAAASR